MARRPFLICYLNSVTYPHLMFTCHGTQNSQNTGRLKRQVI
jgi:hypothetical protein